MAKPKKRTNHLIATAYFRQEVYSPVFLSAFQGLLARVAPIWAETLTVAVDEYSKRRERISRGGPLDAAVQAVAPPKFGIGGAVISGAYKGVLIILASSRSTSAPEANRITIETTDRQEIEGRTAYEWLELLTREVAQALPCRYARAHVADEFDSKNLVREDGGVKAVGTDLRKELPGLYWLNFFGEELVARLGRESLESIAKVVCLEEVDSGFLLRMSEDPNDWSSRHYERLNGEVISALGASHFFSGNR